MDRVDKERRRRQKSCLCVYPIFSAAYIYKYLTRESRIERDGETCLPRRGSNLTRLGEKGKKLGQEADFNEGSR